MNIHVIIGEDDYLVAETAKKTIGDGVGLEVIDSMNAGNADVQLADLRKADESLATPPFLDPRKVTWWKNVGFLPGGKSSEEVKEALERFATRLAAAKLPENQHFILSGPHLLKTSIFAKRLAGAAEIVSFGAEKPWEAARNAAARACDFAAEVGLAFQPGVAEKFAAIVSNDARSLKSEVEKMKCYLGSETKDISAADVAEITSAGAKVEAELWDVTDAIGERTAEKLLTALRKFELESGFAVLMTTVIERFFRTLLDLKEGRAKGLNPYARRKNEAFAAKWSLNELKRARARFLDLRERVVSGTQAGNTLVVTELMRLVPPRRVR